jgi:predicted nucleic acid-binding protein
MNVVDTSGWIEFLFEGGNADVFAPLIEDVDNLLVPVVCLYEVFKKVNAVADEQKALQAIGQMKQGTVIDLTEPLALRAALISLKHHLPMADSFILSTAWSEQARLWTQDEHFCGLPGVEYIKARTKTPSVRGKPRR